MSKDRRILVELLAPPFLAAVWVIFSSSHESETLSVFLIGSIVLVIFAYIFGIIPAVIYAIAMELWFRRRSLGRFGSLCTVGLSGILGALAGYSSAAIGIGLGFLIRSDYFFYLKAGAVIGLLIGFYVGRKQTPAA